VTGRRPRARVISSWFVAALATASLSSGSEDDAALEWDAPAECPDLSSVKRYAERLLGASVDSSCGGSLHARGKVLPTEAGQWRLELSIQVGAHLEEETLVANQCRALGDSMALKLALACDPLAVVQTIQPEAETPAPPPPVARNDRPSPATQIAWGLRAMGGAGFNQLPGVSPGAALFSSLSLPALRFELGGQIYWGAEARYAALPHVGAHLRLYSGTARACLVPRVGVFGFPVCGGLELGWMEGEGFGVEQPFTARSLWGAVSLAAAVRVPVDSQVALWVEGGAVAAFLRPGFNMRNLGELYVAPGGGARATAGLDINFSL
jgi:hypothetical protein